MLLVIFVAAFALFVAAMYYYMKFLTKIMVHRDAELLAQILADGEIPRAWSTKYRRELTKPHSAVPQRAGQLHHRASRHYQRKLRRIVSYAKGTPLLSDDEKRSALKRLNEVGIEWKKLDSYD